MKHNNRKPFRFRTAAVSRQSSYPVQNAREEEKRNFARELHDELGQMLVGLKMEFISIKKTLEPDHSMLNSRVERSLQLLNGVNEAIRRISRQLHPAMLEELGLITALRVMNEEFSARYAMESVFEADTEIFDHSLLPFSTTLGIYRIFQESLTNAGKHSSATSIHNVLKFGKRNIALHITDNGSGFDYKKVKPSRSIGLISMRERAAMMDGSFQINSSPGLGTHIKLIIPYPKPHYMAKILLADDHAIARRGMQEILMDAFPFAEILTVSDSDELMKKVMKDHWDLVIIDINMPGRSGLDTLTTLTKEFPAIPVLVLSMYSENEYGLRVIRDGGYGFLNKSSAVDSELVKAVETILGGRKYLTPALAERMAGVLSGPVNQKSHESLSDREYEIFKLLAFGKSTGQIAEQLSLSVNTIGTLRSRLLAKMKMKSNAELAAYAVREGLF